MIATAPTSVDILDFQFKLHCRLKVFQEQDTSHFNTACNLLAVASRYDLLFVGSNNPYFQVIQIHSLQKYSLKDGDVDNYIRRTISLPSNPQHLSVNCDCTKLSVIVKENDCSKAIIYDITSFMQQNISIIKEIRLSPTPNVDVLEAVWNPAVPTLFTVCKTDGSLAVYDLKEDGIEINELPKNVGARCMCWSPKGKQIAVGSQDGKITQYKPDLKMTRVIDGPAFKEAQFPIALQWISNYQFIAIYRTKDVDGQSNLIVVNCPKGGEVAYINYEDICYSYGNNRPPQFYMLLQSSWNILLVASANSMEVGVLGFEKDVWTQWVLADAARAELPLSPTKQDTLPVGLCLDTSSNQPLPWGESTVPPPPLLLILSDHGVLCCFHAVNLKYSGSICQMPDALTNCAANTFTSSDHIETLPNKPIAINPTKTSTLVPIPQPSTTFSFAFNQGPKPITTSLNNSVTPIAQPFFGGTPIPKSDTTAVKPPTFSFNIKSTLAKNMQPDAKTDVQSQQINMHDKGQVPKQASDPRLVDEKSVNIINTKILEKLEEQTEIDRNETDLLIAQMIREECAMLESEFKAFIKHKHSVKIDLGTDSEATDLVQSTNQLQDFVDEITEICQAQSTEIHFLKQNLIQNWAWYEEARSRFTSDKDPSLVALARAQPLDAASARQLEEIRHLLYYLQSQLTQANAALDEQWEAFQDSCKKRMSLKLPSIEAIYQSMVKQCATVQKQIYILKDISNRIKNTAHIRTIPHLLVSLDNVDILEEQLKHLQLHTKDVLQMRHKGVFEKQRQLTSSKSKNLSELLKTRRFNRVCASKPQLPNNTSMQLHGFSPIIHKKELQPQRLNFMQSTPKMTEDQKNNSVELKKVLQPVANLFEDNCVKPGNKELTIPPDKNTIADNNTKSRNIFTEISNSNSSTFGFSDLKTISAFAPTSQATVAVKNSIDINTNNISLDKSKNVLSSNFFTSPTTTVHASTQSLPISTSSTISSVTNNQKPLFSSKFNNVAVPTTKFAFGSSTTTSIYGVPTSALDVPQKTTFSFSNLTTTTNNEKTTSTNSLINKTSSSAAPFPGYFTFSPNIVSLGNNDVTTTTKSIFSSVVTPSITSKASQDILTSATITTSCLPVSTAPSTYGTKPLEFSQPNGSETTASMFSSLASISSIPTSVTTASVAATTSTTKVPTTVVPVVTVAKTSTNFFAQTGNQIFTAPSTITLISTPTPTSLPLFSIPSNQSLDLTAANKNLHVNTISTATTTTIVTSSTEKPSPITTSPVKSESSATNLDSNAIITVPSSPASSFSFRGVITTSSATLQPSVFQTPPQSTQNIFETTKSSLTTTSIFGNSPPTTSFFGSPQKVFGTPSATVTTATTTTTSALQSIFVANTEVTTTAPSLFNATSVPVSTTQSTLFGSAKVSSSSSQPSVFGVPINSNPVMQGSAFGAPTNNTLVGSQNTPITSGNIFGTASTISGFPTTKSTFAGAFSSTAPTFSTANTSPNFFTPATFGSGSLFSNPISTNAGSIFGGASNTPTSVFDTATTASDTTQFGSVFGTSNTTNAFGSLSDSFRFSTSSGSNISSSSGGFGFNKPAFTTFGNTASSPDTASLSFGNLGLSTTASTFGSAFSQNPFSRAPAQEQKTPFSGGNLFSVPATTTTSNIFGGSSPFNKTAPAFGGPATFGSSPVFGQGSGFSQNTFGANTSVFGNSPSGPFSRNAQTINQTGFGASSLFNSQSTFGSTAPGGFGAPPTFGSPAFGSTPTFNEANKSFSDSFGTTSQQSSNFANLANQPTLGFGNLAQQSQTPTSQPAFSPGSSFSNWR